MSWLNRMSIRWKLVLGTTLTSAFALLLSGAIMAVHENQAFIQQKIDEITVEARILASGVSTSLDFGDVKTAQEYLDALKANPDIVAAGIYGNNRALVSSYSP